MYAACANFIPIQQPIRLKVAKYVHDGQPDATAEFETHVPILLSHRQHTRLERSIESNY